VTHFFELFGIVDLQSDVTIEEINSLDKEAREGLDVIELYRMLVSS